MVNEGFVNSIYTQLCQIASNPVADVAPSERYTQMAWDTPRFGFASPGSDVTDNIVAKLASQWPVSRDRVSLAVQHCLSIVRQEGQGESARVAVLALIASLEHAVGGYTIFIPIVGLTLDDPLPAGPVAITRLAAGEIQRFLNAINEEERELLGQTKNSSRFVVVPYYYESRRQALSEEIPQMVFLRCQERGDEETARVSAARTARLVIDCLRFIMAVIAPHDPRGGHVAASSEVGGPSTWILSDDGSRPHLHSAMGRGLYISLSFDSELVAELITLRVWSVFDLLAESPTKFQEACCVPYVGFPRR